MLKTILLIGTGGFIGSVARFFVSRLNLTIHFYSVPVGTLLVNTTGSFIIGFLMGISAKSEVISSDARLFLMVGLCGGFTTFSSFSMESLTLMHNAQYFEVLAYAFLSLALGFLAVISGYSITNLL